jgi:uridine kinase
MVERPRVRCRQTGEVTDSLDLIVASIDRNRPSTGRQLVAIDGIGASGKSTFTANLAARFVHRPVVELHVDEFFNPPAVRHARGRLSPEGFWLDTYDYDTLSSDALDPLKHGDGSYRSSRSDRSTTSPNRRAPSDAVVLVEGTFLHRDRLRPYWDFSIYLHVPFTVAAQRMAARGTIDSLEDPLLQRYFGAQRIYFEQALPCERASLVLDNSEFDQPAILTINR